MLSMIKLISLIAASGISLCGQSQTVIQTSKSFDYDPETVEVHFENNGEVIVENSGSFPLKFIISNNQAILVDVGEPYDPNEKDGVIILPVAINNFKVTQVSLIGPQTEKRLQNHLKVFDMTLAIFLRKFDCKGLNSNMTKINPDLDPFYEPIVDLPLR